ncbi:MAG: class I SAM-dependent methyltransferase [Bacteroidales bacterium]|jgi:ubiquinone/menaquinone biosynthesis C-methylase UbiE
MRQNVTEIIRTHSGERLEYFREGKNEYLQTLDGTRYPIVKDIICFPDSDTQLAGNNKDYQRMYDRFSGFYDIATRTYALLKNGNEKKRIMQYLSLIDVKDSDRVVEISIGTGRNIVHLNPNAEYWGVDISLGMMKRCMKKMKRLDREITLIQAEAESLPLKDESFDVVFSAGGFNFFNDPGKAVNEMLRIAKPGVKILITDETEKLRLKYSKYEFYKANKVKNPSEYIPEFCRKIEYKEICNGDLYALTFEKP